MNEEDERTCFTRGIHGNCDENCPVLKEGRCEFVEPDDHKVTSVIHDSRPVAKNGINIYWKSGIVAEKLEDVLLFFYDSQQPCPHPGCLHHVTHACEGCGRFNGLGQVYVASLYKNDL